jgi:hypothetical protein
MKQPDNQRFSIDGALACLYMGGKPRELRVEG